MKPQDGSAILRVNLELPSRGGGILAVFQHPSDVARGLLAVPLPTDEHARVPVRLTLTLAPLRRNPGYPALQRVEARLGPSTGNPHYQYLWSLTQRASLGSLADAAASADPEALKDAVQGKLNASTAAMAGALLLARGGRSSTWGLDAEPDELVPSWSRIERCFGPNRFGPPWPPVKLPPSA